MHSVEQFWKRFRLDFRNVALAADNDWRQRKGNRIQSKTLLMFLFQLVSARGKLGYAQVAATAKELVGGKAYSLAPSSLCEARAKLDHTFVKNLFDRTIKHFNQSHFVDLKWQGHRLFCLDASKLNLPRPLVDEGFPVPESGYYPQAMVSCLFNLPSQVPFDYDIESSHNEPRGALKILPRLEPGDIVVYDRGYLFYGLLCEHERLGVHGVFRLKEGTTFTEIKAFQNQQKIDDVAVTIVPHKKTLRDTGKKYPDLAVSPSQRLRLVSYEVEGKRYWLGTTLMDRKKYSIKRLKELYHARWGIEEFFKTTKHYLEIEKFQSKSRRGILQEINAAMVLLAVSKIVIHLEQKLMEDTQKKYFHQHAVGKQLLQQLGVSTSKQPSTIAQESLNNFYSESIGTIGLKNSSALCVAAD